jgi:hypothetical protein
VPPTKNGTAKRVIACPATSSSTTSGGSILPLAAITAGVNLTQITEPTKAKAAITSDIKMPDAWKWHIKAKITTGGSDPHDPGARGSRPRPKHDAISLFIVVEK